ncbi:MAG: AAA family ATPase [Methylococcales symbiont of Iophon sp. n. MRB-2018]|nr:MAG: AAA family ATPase [Methylococcales symbiont of Iophon sp. n. MRB-2018]KAF3978980.1 MAG: AAA family ATPase [Methylococcales symbiont of Iophon sp. n. MRB-2018]
MINRIIIKNFKGFKQDVDIKLSDELTYNPFAFIGPNNSGKTTALQALCLWHIGFKTWYAKKAGKRLSRQGATINRRDLIALPVVDSILLWNNKKTRIGSKKNIDIEIILMGFDKHNKPWEYGLKFYRHNSEIIYSKPLLDYKDEATKIASNINISFLPAMSGLSIVEPRIQPGRVNVLIGEGQTAQVLRNLCIMLYEQSSDNWQKVVGYMKQLFGIDFLNPVNDSVNGTINLYYKQDNIELDLAMAGRGLLQVLLLLSYLLQKPKSIILLDEPDAHLEILRQREVYRLLSKVAKTQQSQVILATHSEVLIEEAVDNDSAIAFIGKVHKIQSNSQTKKALKNIGWSDYASAEQTGWVLYLEGATDLAILQEFAEKLEHPVKPYLDRVFVHYVGNQPNKAREHFFGLLEAKSDLKGIAIFDNISNVLQEHNSLQEIMWGKAEIENYFCNAEVLNCYAKAKEQSHADGNDLFEQSIFDNMNGVIATIQQAKKVLQEPDVFDKKTNGSESLRQILSAYSQKTSTIPILNKSDYYTLIKYLKKDEIDQEVQQKLDSIYAIAKKQAS